VRVRGTCLLNARAESCQDSSWFRGVWEQYLLLYAWVLSTFDDFCVRRAWFYIASSMGFKTWEEGMYSFCMGFKGSHLTCI